MKKKKIHFLRCLYSWRQLLVLGDVREAPLFCPSPRQCGPTRVVHKTGPGNSANFEAEHCF